MELNSAYISNIVESINSKVKVNRKAKDVSNQICIEINKLRPETIEFEETAEEYIYKIIPLKKLIYVTKEDIVKAYEKNNSENAIQNCILSKISEL